VPGGLAAYCGDPPDPTMGIPPLVTIVTGTPRPFAAMTSGKPHALVRETSRTGTPPLATITTTSAIAHSFQMGPSRAARDGRLESGMRTKADVRRYL
jgi:hypothetical protein